MIPAALLKHEITLLSPSTTLDAAGDGDVTEHFRAVAIVPAAIKQSGSVEGVANGATRAVVTYAVTIRHFEGVNETWQLRTRDGRTLAISAVVEQGPHEVPDEMILTAHEVRP